MKVITITLDCGHTRTWTSDVPADRFARGHKVTCKECGAKESVTSIINKASIVLGGKTPVGLPPIDEASRPPAPAMTPPLKSELARYSSDELIAELEDRGRVNKHHSAVLRIADFSMKHTLRCHPDLFNCDIHKKLEQAYLDSAGLCPVVPGHYTLGWNADHKLDLTFVKDLEPAEQ